MKELFQSVEIFRDLTEPELMDIVRTCRIWTISRGQEIFAEGQPGDSMYVIQSGRVRILQMLPDGVPEILTNLGPGEVFGEMAMLDGSDRAASAVAISAVTLYRIDCMDFKVLRANLHPAAYKVIRAIAKVISKRMRETNIKMANFFEDPEFSIKYLQSRHAQLN